ncbi:MAG: hypothetical protein LIO79_10785 [Rikenellaceae bacterium]|nr:hypothetical protein [Rikenellaceae bacterium]
MKRILLFILCVSAICSGYSLQTVNISRNWQFSLNNDISPQSRVTVDIPHTWNYDAVAVKKEYYRGVANYIKDLRIPAEWRGKRVFIRFKGVNSEANLLVNGRFVGEHKGGFTAFTFELTDYLRYGSSNSFWVRVNNSPQLDVMPVNGDFNMYGGIYRDVELIVTDDINISLSDYGSDGVYIRQSDVDGHSARIDAEIHISTSRKRAGNYTVSVDMVEPETGRFAAGEEVSLNLEGSSEVAMLNFTVNNPKLWDGLRKAYLYDIVVKIKSDGVVKDSVVIPYGIRSFEVTPDKGFALNGRPYKLNGVLYHGDISGRGNAMTHDDIEATSI